MSDDIKYMLLPKPKNWTENPFYLFVTILHPMFRKYPMMWRYALGIPFEGSPNVVMYAGFNWDESALNTIKIILEQTSDETSFWDPPVGIQRGVEWFKNHYAKDLAVFSEWNL